MDDVFDLIFEELPLYSNEALRLLGDAVKKEIQGRNKSQVAQVETCDRCGSLPLLKDRIDVAYCVLGGGFAPIYLFKGHIQMEGIESYPNRGLHI